MSITNDDKDDITLNLSSEVWLLYFTLAGMHRKQYSIRAALTNVFPLDPSSEHILKKVFFFKCYVWIFSKALVTTKQENIA